MGASPSYNSYVMKWFFTLRSSASLLMALGLFAITGIQAQSNAVTTAQSGSKVFLRVNGEQLRVELDSLFNANSNAANSDWNTILSNGSNPGMDVDFSGYDATGLGDVSASGTVTSDSLVLSKDATVAGMMTIDSLKVTDIILGQISSLSNLSSDDLTEGTTNLYMTSAERSLLSDMAATLDSLIAVIDALDSSSSPSEGASSCGVPVTYQGYDYATVEIGSQCWFAQNLRSTAYNDDAEIPSLVSPTDWANTTEGALAAYDNSNEGLALYGQLYNWFAVNTGKLCPTGWHVPADEEWTTLTEHLGGESVAGMTMKTAEWGGNNGSGFSALPGGFRHGNGSFNFAGTDGLWWSSTSAGGDIWTRSLWDEGNSLGRNAMGQRNGLSVRCLQDAASTASAPTVVTEAASDVAEEVASLNGSISSDGGETVTASGFRWGALADLSDAQDLVGSGTGGAFTSNLTGLTAGTTYYFTAFATNAGGTAYGDTLSFETAAASLFTCGASTVTFSGYDYATVEIGSQCWFAENLRSTSYNDDVVIPSGLSNSAWQSTTEGAMTIYGEGGADEETNLATYGRLYNWYGVNTGKLCPSGWHVPSDEEWTTLTGHLGSDAGTRMKASASDSPAWDGTNSSGFSALPGGFRDTGNGFFFNQGADGYWWTSSLDGPNASLIYLTTGNPNFGLASTNQGTGFSVRCVQDAAATASVPTVVTSAASDVAEEAATLNGSISSDGGDAVTASGFRWGALADLSDAQDLAGSGTSGAFTGNLTGLTAGTTYYFTAFATNAGGTAYGDTLSFETAASSLFTCGTSAVTFDGHDYATVEIGSQCWLAENLRSTSYNDGEMIPDDVYNEEWTTTTQGATALYDGSEINGDTSGRLYNWYAVNSGKLCPVGWQVPTDAEWTTLTDQLGGESDAGELMKSSASDDPSWNGTNSSGFSGLPGGLRDASGPYYQHNTYGYWWSSSSDSDNTWYRRLGSASDGVHRAIADSPQLGLSVRCIQGTSDR